VELETDNLNFWKSISTLLVDNCLVTDGYRLLYVGSIFSDLLGICIDDLPGRPCDDFFCLENRQSLSESFKALQSGAQNRLNLQLNLIHHESTYSMPLNVEFEQLELSGLKFIVGILPQFNTDLTSKQGLISTRLQLNAILDHFSNTIFRTNMQGEITLISENVKDLMGYTQEEVIGTRLADYYWTPEDRIRSVQEVMNKNGDVAQLDTVMRHKDGSPVWLASNVQLIKNQNGEPVAIEGIGHDVTYQKKLEKKLESLALTDNLTQLPNRRALMDELHRHYVSSIENKSPLALIIMDIKKTKTVNEQFGYLYGDLLLNQVATLLKVYTQFPQVLGRFSGDEFLYVLPGYTVKNAVQFIAPVIEAVTQDRLVVGNKKVPYSLSIGMTELRKNDKNEFAMLDRADKATLVSKKGIANFEVM
jgi:diguanylate cyclase (GGDEF)-like protein/PAS domain S-box-containing protein